MNTKFIYDMGKGLEIICTKNGGFISSGMPCISPQSLKKDAKNSTGAVGDE